MEELKKNYPKQVQLIEHHFKENADHIRIQLTEEAVLKFLKDHAKIKEVKE
jgi:hypothetical protein